MTKISDNDPDNHHQNAGLADQLGHRDQDPLIKDADSDFPEPGNSAEHSTGSSPSIAKKSNSKVA